MNESYKLEYLDTETRILFSENPQISVRYILPSMNEVEKKSIKKYPFINKTNLKVRIENLNNNKIYQFEIPKGYCYDGASIPRFFWRVIGSQSDNQFLIAALIHDVLCENHNFIENDRALSTKVFDLLLKNSEVMPIKRFFMKNSVDIFQKLFCHWKNK